jgi:parallel beta-helix repeat protein
MRIFRIVEMLLLLALLCGCALRPVEQTDIFLQGDVLLERDNLWRGKVVVDGSITVAAGATLRIAPGTQIFFVRRDSDRDGLGDATLVIKGRLEAIGTQLSPIKFASAEKEPVPGDWLEIRSDFARELLFEWCEFRDSAYTLHAHFTRGHLLNSHIHRNIDGSRLGRSKFLVQHNLIENNAGKGINFRDSAVSLKDNIIRNNRVGIFLFERPGTSVITGNNLVQNQTNLQLGDFFTAHIALSGNWWGSSDSDQIAETIHDYNDDAELGRVDVAPATEWNFDAGPQNQARFVARWQYETAGFVDSPPLRINEILVFASWDGHLRALSEDGALIWQSAATDIIDGLLLPLGDKVLFQNWQRQFFAANLADGQLHEFFQYPPSPADDHRQAGAILTATDILLPGWNGWLYSFNRKTLRPGWQFNAGQPLRAAPLFDGEQIYIASGHGLFSVLSPAGELQWQAELGTPLLSSPFRLAEEVGVLGKDGQLRIFTLDGQPRWQLFLPPPAYYAAPLPTDEGLFVATAAGYLAKIDPHRGQILWQRQLDHPVYCTPAMSAAGLLIGDNGGQLLLIDPLSGRTLAQYQTGGPIQSVPLVTRNRLFFGSRDQKLHALEILTGAPAP